MDHLNNEDDADEKHNPEILKRKRVYNLCKLIHDSLVAQDLKGDFMEELNKKYKISGPGQLIDMNKCLFMMYAIEVMDALGFVHILYDCDKEYLDALGVNNRSSETEDIPIEIGYPQKVKILNKEVFIDFLKGYIIPYKPITEREYNIGYISAFDEIGWGIYRPDFYNVAIKNEKWKQFFDWNKSGLRVRKQNITWNDFYSSVPLPIYYPFITNGSVIEFLGIQPKGDTNNPLWVNRLYPTVKWVTGLDSYLLVKIFYDGTITFSDLEDDINDRVNLLPKIPTNLSALSLGLKVRRKPTDGSVVSSSSNGHEVYFLGGNLSRSASSTPMRTSDDLLTEETSFKNNVQTMVRGMFGNRAYRTDYGTPPHDSSDWSKLKDTAGSILKTFTKYFGASADDKRMTSLLRQGSYNHFNEMWNRKLSKDDIIGVNEVLKYIFSSPVILDIAEKDGHQSKKFIIEILRSMCCFACKELRVYTIQLLQYKIRQLEISRHLFHPVSLLNKFLTELHDVLGLMKYSWILKRVGPLPSMRYNLFVDINDDDTANDSSKYTTDEDVSSLYLIRDAEEQKELEDALATNYIIPRMITPAQEGESESSEDEDSDYDDNRGDTTPLSRENGLGKLLSERERRQYIAERKRAHSEL